MSDGDYGSDESDDWYVGNCALSQPSHVLFRVLKLEQNGQGQEFAALERTWSRQGAEDLLRGGTNELHRVDGLHESHLGSFVVEHGVTTLTQAADEACWHPTHLRHYLEANDRAVAAPVVNSASEAVSRALNIGSSMSACQHRLSPSVLLHGPARRGKRKLVEDACDAVGMKLLMRSAASLVTSAFDDSGSVAHALSRLLAEAARCAPCALCLRRLELLGDIGRTDMAVSNASGAGDSSGCTSPHHLGTEWDELLASALDELRQHFDHSAMASVGTTSFSSDNPIPAVIIIGSARILEGVPAKLRSSFTTVVAAPAPSVAEREGSLRVNLFAAHTQPTTHATYRRATEEHPAFSAAEWRVACAHARSLAEATSGTLRRGACGLGNVEMTEVVRRMASLGAATLGRPRVPNVQWADVGGQEEAKQAILETIQLPLLQPQVFAGGLRQRSGVLLYGPPGTGKTMLAKAVATECNLAFLGIKGPELLSPYVGESERRVRDLFVRAREASPCVIFFDEIDALVPSRGAAGDAGGVVDRVVSQLMAELDGLHSGDTASDGGHREFHVFVLAATNRLDLMDASLLRPGRFEKHVYIGPPCTHSQQRNVLTALTRRFQFAGDVCLDSVCEWLPLYLSSADLSAICAGAVIRAIHAVVAWKASRSHVVSQGIACVRTVGDVDSSKPSEKLDPQEPTIHDADVIVHARHFDQAAAEFLNVRVRTSSTRR